MIEDHLKTYPFIMNADVQVLCNVSAATVNRILAGRAKEGELAKYRGSGHWVYRKMR